MLSSFTYSQDLASTESNLSSLWGKGGGGLDLYVPDFFFRLGWGYFPLFFRAGNVFCPPYTYRYEDFFRLQNSWPFSFIIIAQTKICFASHLGHIFSKNVIFCKTMFAEVTYMSPSPKFVIREGTPLISVCHIWIYNAESILTIFIHIGRIGHGKFGFVCVEVDVNLLQKLHY